MSALCRAREGCGRASPPPPPRHACIHAHMHESMHVNPCTCTCDMHMHAPMHLSMHLPMHLPCAHLPTRAPHPTRLSSLSRAREACAAPRCSRSSASGRSCAPATPAMARRTHPHSALCSAGTAHCGRHSSNSTHGPAHVQGAPPPPPPPPAPAAWTHWAKDCKSCRSSAAAPPAARNASLGSPAAADAGMSCACSALSAPLSPAALRDAAWVGSVSKVAPQSAGAPRPQPPLSPSAAAEGRLLAAGGGGATGSLSALSASTRRFCSIARSAWRRRARLGESPSAGAGDGAGGAYSSGTKCVR